MAHCPPGMYHKYCLYELPHHHARRITLAVKPHSQVLCGWKPRVCAVRRGDDGDVVRVTVWSEGGPDHLPVRKERDELREPLSRCPVCTVEGSTVAQKTPPPVLAGSGNATKLTPLGKGLATAAAFQMGTIQAAGPKLSGEGSASL
jgi:hypothetical protein